MELINQNFTGSTFSGSTPYIGSDNNHESSKTSVSTGLTNSSNLPLFISRILFTTTKAKIHLAKLSFPSFSYKTRGLEIGCKPDFNPLLARNLGYDFIGIGRALGLRTIFRISSRVIEFHQNRSLIRSLLFTTTNKNRSSKRRFQIVSAYLRLFTHYSIGSLDRKPCSSSTGIGLFTGLRTFSFKSHYQHLTGGTA